MANERPTPEQFLELANAEARQEKTGKLKIFLGAAPGVGKTFTMLQAAKSKMAEDLDVVAGIIETHGREETAELIKGLEILPRHSSTYHGRILQEFDLDGALKRHPAILLVDEMAHRNAPSSRHSKRWQDIKELLDRGIDVYTTLNVQHIESLNDVVAQITGVRVRETVPDSMLEFADNIELVDLPPDDLLKRLQEGKVYFPQQAQLASEHFFKKSNLTALRELALRVTTERVSAQMMLERQDQAVSKNWPTLERLMVCVGPGPNSAKIIRAAKRLANTLNAEWVAVFMDAPRLKLDDSDRESSLQNLRLAETLGADTHVLNGLDMIKSMLRFARERNISKIVVGKKIRPRWQDFLRRSLVDELVRQSGEIDIYIIRGEEAPDITKIITPPKTQHSHSWWKGYSSAVGIVFLCTLINALLYDGLLDHIMDISNVIMIYLLGVSIIALQGLRGPSILACVLSVVVFDFFFVPPIFSFAVTDMQYLITMGVMLILAQLLSHLTIVVRQQAITAKLKERHTHALYTLTKQLSEHRGQRNILTHAILSFADIFDAQVMALLPARNQRVEPFTAYPENQTLEAKEQSIAQWTYDLGQKAGLGTQTLSVSNALYLPMDGSQEILGVLRIQPQQPTAFLDAESLLLVEALVKQLTLALEVDRLQA